MKIRVTNFGAIEEGTFDLSKRINLFCGLNGTGKTYISYLIYGLLSAHIHIKGNDEMAQRLFNDRSCTIELSPEEIYAYRQEMLKHLKSDIDSIFGIGEDVADKIFKDSSIDFVDTLQNFTDTIYNAVFDTVIHVQGVKVLISKPQETMSMNLKIVDENITGDSLQGFTLLLHSALLYTLAIYPIGGAEVFPVERNSIYTFSKELSIRKQEAMDSISMLASKDRKVSKFDVFFSSINTKRYPLPIKDGLLVAEDLVEIKKKKSQYFEFANTIEKDLLHGIVQISADGEIQFVSERSRRTAIPIQMSASVVKTLSSLVVYLKHIAKPNDLIIIDEPEINLHPHNQVRLARILARLANHGFRLLISTHSDYIIREFNNLVMLSDKQNDSVNKIRLTGGYQEDEYINIESINVYSFGYKSRSSKKVTVRQVEVDKFGFAIDIIDNVIESVNMIAENLYYATKYPETNME